MSCHLLWFVQLMRGHVIQFHELLKLWGTETQFDQLLSIYKDCGSIAWDFMRSFAVAEFNIGPVTRHQGQWSESYWLTVIRQCEDKSCQVQGAGDKGWAQFPLLSLSPVQSEQELIQVREALVPSPPPPKPHTVTQSLWVSLMDCFMWLHLTTPTSCKGFGFKPIDGLTLKNNGMRLLFGAWEQRKFKKGTVLKKYKAASHKYVLQWKIAKTAFHN